MQVVDIDQALSGYRLPQVTYHGPDVGGGEPRLRHGGSDEVNYTYNYSN